MLVFIKDIFPAVLKQPITKSGKSILTMLFSKDLISFMALLRPKKLSAVEGYGF